MKSWHLPHLFSSGILPVILANSADFPGFRPTAIAEFFHAGGEKAIYYTHFENA